MTQAGFEANGSTSKLRKNDVKISKTEVNVAQSGEITRSNLDQITPENLAALWASGAIIAASLADKALKGATTQKFQSADVLMVRVDLAKLPLKAALAADFTQRYATVACHTVTDGGGELLLAFQLPATVVDAKTYVRLLAGLETLYAGASHHACAEQGYGLAGGTAVVLGGKLNPEAVRRLDRLGQETKELRKGRGAYLRSHVTLDRMSVVTVPDGDSYPLEQLPKELEVFCPVHVGAVPTGIVHWYADGTPGVQCSHCKRTYAARRTQRDYDFGFFDRTVKALGNEQEAARGESGGGDAGGANVKFLASRYLPALDLTPGVTFVKSPKGTGKTQALEALVARCKKQHLRVLLLGHRRALLQSISARLGLDCYFMIEDEEAKDTPDFWVFDGETDELRQFPDPILSGKEEARYQRVEPTKHYAICLDSMMELEPGDKKQRYQVVIIDEAEQVFAHLTGETLKGRRREVFARLAHYLKVAQHVVLLDADLNMVTMAAAFEVFHPTMPARFIINEPKTQNGEIHLYSNRGQLAKLLTDSVGAGQKVFVATNSKRKAVDLSKMILEHHPGKRVAVVTADNSQQKEVQVLLGDVTRRFERDLDVLIASPAIGTGIDITFKDGNGEPRKVVDSVFGFFEANIVTHFDIDQQLMRVRHPGEVHVWVDATVLNYETDVGCIKRELEKTVRRTSYLLRYEDDGMAVFAEDNGLVNIWAQVLAAARGSKNKLGEFFRTLRVEGGWNLADVEYDDGAAAFGKAALAAAKESRLAERKEHLLEAEKLAADEAARLAELDERGLPLTDNERHALERFKIESFYADSDISEKLIDFDNEGRTRECVMRMECLMSKREWFEIRDERDLEDGVLIFDRRRYLPQRDVLEAIFAASGMFDPVTRKFRTDVNVEAATLKPFLQVLDGKRRQVEALFGMPIYADCWSKPVVQLNGILGLVGLALQKTETEQKGGKKVRRYGIPADLLNGMAWAVKVRDLKYKRDTAERPQSGEDKLSRQRSNKLTEALNLIKAKRGNAATVSAPKKLAVVEAFCDRAAA